MSHATQQDFDRAGRLATIDYLSESPKLTPDVIFSYDKQGNRTLMEETADGGSTYVRKTGYQYDDARRLIQVDFDTDGDDVVEESVQYTYDAGGLRTQLELPDAKTIVYTYDQQGRLIGLEDWDNQMLSYSYDLSGRMRAAENDNGLERRHNYDAGGRLRQISYATPDAVLGHFAYTLDARGNRIAATETLKSPSVGSTTLLSDDDAIDYYKGTWSASGDYMASTNFSAALRLAFFGDEITLTLGQDDDHGICDIYVNNVLWGSLDTYAASAGDEAVTLYLDSEGPHILDIRNRPDKHMASTGYRLSFKQVVMNAQYDSHTIQYTYDGLSRLIAADYFEGENVDGTAFREYDFAYDVAGNRTQQVVEIAGSPTTTNYTYDVANRLTAVDAQSVTYNNAGQMTDDGTLTYSWDRGGRLLSAGSSSYAYNGLGNRLSQTVSSIVTDYLLDLQPGLSKVLAATTGANVDRFVHSPQGIHAQHDATNGWRWMIQDGLGGVRGQVDNTLAMQGSRHFAPYGTPFGAQGSFDLPFGFTGEPTDDNGLVHLRARYLNPALGIFPSLDPVEGALQQAMSLNRYGYVAGNVTNFVDPTGHFGISTERIGMDNAGCSSRFPQQQQPSDCPWNPLGSIGYLWTDRLLGSLVIKRCGANEWQPFGNAYEVLMPGDEIRVNDNYLYGRRCAPFHLVTFGSDRGTRQYQGCMAPDRTVQIIDANSLNIPSAPPEEPMIFDDIALMGEAILVLGGTNVLAPPWGTGIEEGLDLGLIVLGSGIWVIANVLDLSSSVSTRESTKGIALGLGSSGGFDILYTHAYGLQHKGIRAYEYNQWHKEGLSDIHDTQGPGFATMFEQAAMRAHHIHFCVWGYNHRTNYSSPVEWANSEGWMGRLPAGGGANTATELYIIMTNPFFCQKTLFYDTQPHWGYDYLPNESLGYNICSEGFRMYIDSGRYDF